MESVGYLSSDICTAGSIPRGHEEREKLYFSWRKLKALFKRQESNEHARVPFTLIMSDTKAQNGGCATQPADRPTDCRRRLPISVLCRRICVGDARTGGETEGGREGRTETEERGGSRAGSTPVKNKLLCTTAGGGGGGGGAPLVRPTAANMTRVRGGRQRPSRRSTWRRWRGGQTHQLSEPTTMTPPPPPRTPPGSAAKNGRRTVRRDVMNYEMLNRPVCPSRRHISLFLRRSLLWRTELSSRSFGVLSPAR